MRGVNDANGETLLGEFPQRTASTKGTMRVREQRKFAKKVNDDEENDVGGGCGAVRSKIERRGGLGRNG